MSGIASVMEEHELAAVSFDGQHCSCGVVRDRLVEHLAQVALDVLSPVRVTAADVARTKRVLRARQARNEELGRRADELGLTGFVERSAWLLTQRTPDERLADERRWGALEARVRALAPAPDRALEIALGVYDRLPVQERAAWRQPRDRFAHLGDHNADQPDRRSA